MGNNKKENVETLTFKESLNQGQSFPLSCEETIRNRSLSVHRICKEQKDTYYFGDTTRETFKKNSFCFKKPHGKTIRTICITDFPILSGNNSLTLSKKTEAFARHFQQDTKADIHTKYPKE